MQNHLNNTTNNFINTPLFTLIILLFLSCPFLKSQDFEGINDDLLKIIRKHNVPGVTFCIVTPEINYSSGVGKISISGSSRMDGNTRLRVGSLTKSFIAIGLLQLQEKGIISLNDHLKDIIPEISIENSWESPISIRHLLEHTSGLSELNFNEIYSNDKNLRAIEVINRTPTALKVQIRPGSYFQYSNSGYLLAGYILEKYAQQPFETYLEQHILNPLGMKNSTFDPFYLGGSQPKHHIYKNNRIINSPHKEIMNRWAGSLSTTSDDMAKFISFLSSREQNLEVLKKSSFEEFETPTTSIAAQNGIQTGYALGIMKNTLLNQIVVGNRGGSYDLHARYNYRPGKKTGFFFSMNISNGACARELNQYLSEIVFSESKSEMVNENYQLKDNNLEMIQGFYQSENSRMRILTGIDKLLSGVKVFKVNDTLFLKENGRSTKPIFTLDGKKFFTSGSNVAHILIGQKSGLNYLIETNEGGGFYYKTSSFGFRLRQFSVFGALTISILTGFFFILKVIVEGIKGNFEYLQKYWIYALLPMLLVILFLIPISVERYEIEKLGSFNAMTFSLFLISILYPVLTIFCSYKTYILYKNRITKRLRFMTWLSFGSAIILTAFMLYYNYFGVILW